MLTMKAVRIHEYGPPDVLRYEDVPRPDAVSGEILIQVHAVGVNPVDWKVREGRIPRYTLPMILGRDPSGIVVTAGPDTSKFKEGDEVYSMVDSVRNGGYAEYIAVPESEIAHKPRTIDHIHSAAVPLASLTAWQSIFDLAHLSAGQTILIHGAAGGVGHFAVQFAKWKGAKVIGTAGADGGEMIKQLGADEAIDYTKTRFEDVVHDVDVVFDLVGGDTQQRSWQVLRKGGVLVSTVGIASPEAAEQYGVRSEAVVSHPDPAQLEEIGSLIDQGAVKPVLQAVLPLEKATEAHEMLQRGHVHGKIVLQTA